MCLHVGKARKSGVADEVDLVVRGVESMNGVMADRLGEHEQVVPARAGEIVVARQGEDRRAFGIDLHIVGNNSICRYCRRHWSSFLLH